MKSMVKWKKILVIVVSLAILLTNIVSISNRQEMVYGAGVDKIFNYHYNATAKSSDDEYERPNKDNANKPINGGPDAWGWTWYTGEDDGKFNEDQAKPWWEMDLGEAKKLTTLRVNLDKTGEKKIYNHLKILASNEDDVAKRFKEGDTTEVTLYTAGEIAENVSNPWIEIDMSDKAKFRYFRIRKTIVCSGTTTPSWGGWLAVNNVEALYNAGVKENLALNKTCIASDNQEAAYKATNGNADDGWNWGWTNQPAWIQVDLGKPYIITDVELKSHWVDNSDWTRTYFKVIASNDPNFAEGSDIALLGEQGAVPYNWSNGHGRFIKENIKLNQKYQYVRAVKTKIGPEGDWGSEVDFVVSDFQVFGGEEFEINNFSYTISGNDVKINLNGLNRGNTVNYKVIIASYSGAGSLKEVNVKNVEFAKDVPVNINETFMLNSPQDVKVLLWNSLDNISPVAVATQQETIYYVATIGDDNASGSSVAPFKTLEKALSSAYVTATTDNVKIMMMDFVYMVASPVEIRNSNHRSNKITVMSGVGGTKITGGEVLVPTWTLAANGIYKAKVTGDMGGYSMFFNDVDGVMARNEEKISGTSWYTVGNNVKGVYVNKADIGNIVGEENMQIHWSSGWLSYSLPIESVEESGNFYLIKFKGSNPEIVLKKDKIGHNPMFYQKFYLENAKILLDTEGEFYFDKRAMEVYYKPFAKQEINSVEIVAPKAECLVNICGDNTRDMVNNISFSGIEFAYTTWNKPYDIGWFGSQSQWISMEEEGEFYGANNTLGKSFTPALIKINNAQNITFEDCVIRGSGNVGIGIYNGASDININGNVFEDTKDSAITVGLPSHAFVDDDMRDVAFGQPTSSSSSSWRQTGKEAVNGFSYWGFRSSSESSGNPWWQVDLGRYIPISQIHIFPCEYDNSAELRRNFKVVGSNTSDFSSGEVLFEVRSDGFANKAIYKQNVSSNYRYLTVTKTVNEPLFIGEFRAMSADKTLPASEVQPKNINITNNVINRAGRYFYGAPGIQSYYTENMTIANNNLQNLPYSAIAVGWGWNNYPSSTTCKNNSILNNKIENVLTETFDGGGIYTMGSQENTVIVGNYIKNVINGHSAFYPDEGSNNVTINQNVIEDAHKWIYIHTDSIKNITGTNNYSTTVNITNNGVNTNLSTPTTFIPTNKLEAILRIEEKAGVAPRYINNIEKISKICKNTFGVEPYRNYYDSVGKGDVSGYNSLNPEYLLPMIKNAELALSLNTVSSDKRTQLYLKKDAAQLEYDNVLKNKLASFNAYLNLKNALNAFYGY